MNIINYAYNGNPISFAQGDNVMVNATQMAKQFGKQPVFWLNNQYTKEFLGELSKLRNLSLADLVQVTKGGSNPGTWMHEDVAIEFARWLSPGFAIWCNDRIKEILQGQQCYTSKGLVHLQNEIALLTERCAYFEERANWWKERSEFWRKETFAETKHTIFYVKQLVKTTKELKKLRMQK